MPQEPKKRHSRQRKGKRRSGIVLKTRSGLPCMNCGDTILPHAICKNCGYYKGKQMLVLKKEKDKESKSAAK
jgi:large subunit ribosomal protein L32